MTTKPNAVDRTVVSKLKLVKVKCDCLNYCGDDPWLRDGRAMPCAERRARDNEMKRRPKVRGVGRDKDDPKTLMVYLDRAYTDDHLRAIHDFLQGF